MENNAAATRAVNRVPWAPYWKAVLGFIAPAASTLIIAVQDGSAGGSAITQSEWITALCTAVVTSGAVAVKGNYDPKREHRDESVRDPA